MIRISVTIGTKSSIQASQETPHGAFKIITNHDYLTRHHVLRALYYRLIPNTTTIHDGDASLPVYLPGQINYDAPFLAYGRRPASNRNIMTTTTLQILPPGGLTLPNTIHPLHLVNMSRSFCPHRPQACRACGCPTSTYFTPKIATSGRGLRKPST
ncbi:hypothetical protein LZ30DRAFT_689949 [Colletotrichum cereale]|nr:hypothetical protein LZ30DRAFT_689949 [Colletotrichum cereale]